MEIPQKIKNRTTINDPAIPLLGIYLKEMKSLSQRGICTSMFVALLFKIANTWKQSKHPSMDEWIKKMEYIPHTMEYYWNEILMEYIHWNIIQP